MAKKCPVSKKSPMFGHKVSHAQNKTKRRFEVSLQWRNMFFVFEDVSKSARLRISQHAYRTINKIRNTDGDKAAFEFLQSAGII